jgi:hypothetical protein
LRCRYGEDLDYSQLNEEERTKIARALKDAQTIVSNPLESSLTEPKVRIWIRVRICVRVRVRINVRVRVRIRIKVSIRVRLLGMLKP